jgi:long-chain acyl-CoA synthetase
MTALSTFETLPQLLDQRVGQTSADVAFAEKEPSGRWRTISWEEFGGAVGRLAAQLWVMGLRPRDRAGLWMPNSLLWETIQHALYRLGVVVVGIDLNDPATRVQEILHRCAPKVLFVQDPQRLEQIALGSSTRFQTILTHSGCAPVAGIPDVIRLQELAQPPAAPIALPLVNARDTATMVFTSGTTGQPKALSYRHDQVALAIQSIAPFFADLPDQTRTACWLPLANPFQRMINFCALAMNWQSFIVPSPAAIMSQVQEIAPHLFAAVPRFYEKLWEGIRQKIDALPPRRRAVTQWALGVGRRGHRAMAAGAAQPWWARLQLRIADHLVLQKIRAVMGPNLRYFISGSAAMPRQLIESFESLGWTLLEAYGISENIVPMAMNAPQARRPGSVGRPLAANTVRMAENGEILVQSAGVAAEAAPMTPDGFLKTGDTGRLDEQGFLWLSGRASDMFKLSTGRKIIPKAIEEAIAQIEAVEHCIAAGSNRQFVTALLNIPPDRWNALVKKHGSPQNTLADLRTQIQRQCAHLPEYCRPVDVAVVNELFSPQTGELTANLKLRRAFVLRKHADQIDALYRRIEQRPARGTPCGTTS